MSLEVYITGLAEPLEYEVENEVEAFKKILKINKCGALKSINNKLMWFPVHRIEFISIKK